MEYFNQLSNYYKNDGENYFNKYINEKVGFAAATGVVSGLLAAALAGQIAMSMLPGAQMSALGVGLTITAIALVGIMVGVESDQVVNLKKNRAL
jgi:hypothetical protein